MQRTALLLALGAVLGCAQELRLSAGAADYEVFQRDAANKADLSLGGTAQGVSGAVEARLTTAGKPVRGFNWTTVATASGATWSGKLAGVPMGGPYTLELRAKGATPVIVKDLLVGDLWVLAGQSNMEGVGNLKDVTPPDPRVHSFTSPDEWAVAKEPLHELPASPSRVHWPKGRTERMTGEELAKWRAARIKGAGMGLPFAVEMVKRTGVPIGLVPCAHGGTSMTQWDPALRDKLGDSLYGSMYRRVQAVGGKVKGVLWYQGESDANPKAVDAYRGKFEALIAAVRKDFEAPELPFYYVQLGRHVNADNHLQWNRVQNDERLIEQSVAKTGVVAAVDLALDDGIHIGTPALKTLAVRMANVVTRDLFPEAKQFAGVKRGPRVQSAIWKAAQGNASVIRVSFAEVNGALTASGRPAGFSVHGSDGAAIPMIYRVDLEGAEAVLHVQGKLQPGMTVAYGAGKDPYCNVVDAAGMGMLTFWGVPITE